LVPSGARVDQQQVGASIAVRRHRHHEGRRHCYHRTGSVAEAIVAHRPASRRSSPTCSRVPTTRSFASFDRRTRTSPAYPLTNSSTQSRCGNTASNIVGIAFRRVSGGSSSSLGSTVSGISAAANPYGLPSACTARNTAACAFRLLCCPLQTGHAGWRVVEPNDNLVSHPAPPRTGRHPTLPMMLACAAGRHCHCSLARRTLRPRDLIDVRSATVQVGGKRS
jgi:hypothetical protein